MILRAALGLAASVGISLAGYRAGALTRNGVIAAVGVGTSVIGGTGWRGATVLGAFFVSSSALSRIGRTAEVATKGSRRDAGQVLANGSVAALTALTAARVGERRALAWLSGSLAAAAADTWATEIGSSARQQPRTLIGRRVVEPGVSGGVTVRGWAGAAGGALLVSVVHATVTGRNDRRSSAACVIAGLCGSLVDSALGELVQERRFCAVCERPTEARMHRCETPSVLIGGVRGIDNDVVNLLCTLTGAGIAALVSR